MIVRFLVAQLYSQCLHLSSTVWSKVPRVLVVADHLTGDCCSLHIPSNRYHLVPSGILLKVAPRKLHLFSVLLPGSSELPGGRAPDPGRYSCQDVR
jgi:hypothetical protein